MIKMIKATHGVDFAAVGTSVINASICRCLKLGGKNVPAFIDVMSALPHPDHTGVMCNYGVTGDFPLDSNSSVERLHQTDAILKHISADVGMQVNSNVVVSLGLLPTAVAYKLFSSIYKLGPSYLVSVLPTTSTAEYIDDGEIVDVFLITVLRSDLGMNVHAWGGNNQQRYNFVMDKNVLGCSANIGHAFTEEMKKLAITKL
ncbi:unnamed protein product [Allacma fusca]|uniref:Uncharacterized protein n=1 Tax=Allacma fusca TaxID=39272 RepID=A0A8J2LXL5_9HEXA|nr:unnamed protein product [Allacma fusca]